MMRKQTEGFLITAKRTEPTGRKLSEKELSWFWEIQKNRIYVSIQKME